MAVLLGFASAIVDNVPLVAAAQGMYDIAAPGTSAERVGRNGGGGGREGGGERGERGERRGEWGGEAFGKRHFIFFATFPFVLTPQKVSDFGFPFGTQGFLKWLGNGWFGVIHSLIP